MPKAVNELVDTPKDPQELLDQKTRSIGVFLTGAVAGATTSDNPTEDKISENVIALTDGDRAGLILTKSNTTLSSSGDAVLTATVEDRFGNRIVSLRVDNDSKISNIRTVGATHVGQFGVTQDVTAVFENCIFDDTVTIRVGCKAHFIGCLFRGTPSTDNQSGVADVYIIGCTRKVGVHASPVTTIAETT